MGDSVWNTFTIRLSNPTWKTSTRFSFLQWYQSKSGVNFINTFTSSFYTCRSQKCKKLLDLTVFFVLLGPVSVRAACKMLMKLTPGFRHHQSQSHLICCFHSQPHHQHHNSNGNKTLPNEKWKKLRQRASLINRPDNKYFYFFDHRAQRNLSGRFKRDKKSCTP